MEMGYSQLRQKDVINVKDGKKLGRITDIIFSFPEGHITGFVVPEACGFFQPEIFVSVCNVVKVGADTILIDIPPICRSDSAARRKDQFFKPPFPPQPPTCPPTYPPSQPSSPPPCAPSPPPPRSRSFEDEE